MMNLKKIITGLFVLSFFSSDSHAEEKTTWEDTCYLIYNGRLSLYQGDELINESSEYSHYGSIIPLLIKRLEKNLCSFEGDWTCSMVHGISPGYFFLETENPTYSTNNDPNDIDLTFSSKEMATNARKKLIHLGVCTEPQLETEIQ